MGKLVTIAAPTTFLGMLVGVLVGLGVSVESRLFGPATAMFCIFLFFSLMSILSTLHEILNVLRDIRIALREGRQQ